MAEFCLFRMALDSYTKSAFARQFVGRRYLRSWDPPQVTGSYPHGVIQA
jgi:hypothetical protein